MKTQLLLTALLVLFGCGAPAPQTQSQSPVVEPSAVTTADEFTGKVIRVVDGDTIDVLTDAKETIRIRLHGIDCPERGQPFGNNATQALKASILGNVVKVVSHGQDRYDRTIGEIYHDGDQINHSLVAAGLAWHYVKYAAGDTALAGAETQARELKTGLWSGSHKVIAPWCTRSSRNSSRTASPESIPCLVVTIPPSLHLDR